MQAKREWSEIIVVQGQAFDTQVIQIGSTFPWFVVTLPVRTGPGRLVAFGSTDSLERAKAEAIAARDRAIGERQAEG